MDENGLNEVDTASEDRKKPALQNPTPPTGTRTDSTPPQSSKSGLVSSQGGEKLLFVSSRKLSQDSPSLYASS